MRPPGIPPIDDAARDAYFAFAAKGVCSGDPEARAAYCTMIDGLHQTMPDPYDNSIAFPAIWMGHAELVMKIYSERTSVSNLFGLMTLWVDADPIRRTIQHPDFMRFAERVGSHRKSPSFKLVIRVAVPAAEERAPGQSHESLSVACRSYLRWLRYPSIRATPPSIIGNDAARNTRLEPHCASNI